MKSKSGWQNRIVGYGDADPSSLIANPQNYRRHPTAQANALTGSLNELGWIQDVLVNRTTGRMIDGHLRAEQALAHGEKSVPVKYVELSEAEERLALATLDPITYMAETDAAALASLLEGVNTGDAALQELLANMGSWASVEAPHESEASAIEEQPPRAPDGYVPDTVWPTNNDYGIPLLDLNMQAVALDEPVLIWGSVSRTTAHRGTWLFYTNDYRYEALWRDPGAPVRTQCLTCAEPNFSAYTNMPFAVALWSIYRKRWIARFWQSQGIRIVADLNVGENWATLNTSGIPAGWKAFSTRGYVSRLDATHREYAIAQRIAGDGVTPLFVVYGGNAAVRDECKRMGWQWIPERMDVANEVGWING